MQNNEMRVDQNVAIKDDTIIIEKQKVEQVESVARLAAYQKLLICRMAE